MKCKKWKIKTVNLRLYKMLLQHKARLVDQTLKTTTKAEKPNNQPQMFKIEYYLLNS